MFEQLYKRQHARNRHHKGPMAEERIRFLEHAARLQMSQSSLGAIARYTLIVAHAINLSERPGKLIGASEVTAAAEQWVHRRPRVLNARRDRRFKAKFAGHAIRWLSYLGRLQAPEKTCLPCADRVEQYVEYMLEARGLSPWTIKCNRGGGAGISFAD